MLLDAAKCQGYNSYRFWIIKGKPTAGVKLLSPYHTQTRVKQEVPSQRRKSAKKSLQKYLIK